MERAMSGSRSLSVAGKLTVAGLVVAAAGIVIQIASGADQLGDPTRVGVFVGTVIQLLALAIALIAGVVAARQSYRTRPRARG
jgi:hypothetical protein